MLYGARARRAAAGGWLGLLWVFVLVHLPLFAVRRLVLRYNLAHNPRRYKLTAAEQLGFSARDLELMYPAGAPLVWQVRLYGPHRKDSKCAL
jgi:hypothetical protein